MVIKIVDSSVRILEADDGRHATFGQEVAMRELKKIPMKEVRATIEAVQLLAKDLGLALDAKKAPLDEVRSTCAKIDSMLRRSGSDVGFDVRTAHGPVLRRACAHFQDLFAANGIDPRFDTKRAPAQEARALYAKFQPFLVKSDE